MSIVKKIQALCQQNGIKIAQLERELGFGNATIRSWGVKSDPSFSKIKKVADYFNVSCDSLYAEESKDFYISSSPELDRATNYRITRIRHKENLNQTKFADSLGISIDTVRCIDQNRKPASPELIQRVCNVYNINKRWLMDGTGDIMNVSGKLFDDEKTMLCIFRKLPDEFRKCALSQINELSKICVDK